MQINKESVKAMISQGDPNNYRTKTVSF